MAAGTWNDHDRMRALADRVPGSASLRYEREGHALYLSGKPCVVAHANRYLIDLRPPPANAACVPEQ
ncbi:alpha/beta hydrolase [Sinosporangium siamense]|uniref:alpha/beta hydrolase n=1 Tax=Sinosporangium siamense TaxID=1367973 RepID=UPI001EF2AE4C|nr:alpha/beta hydrolase [Sinosporangium siamense]